MYDQQLLESPEPQRRGSQQSKRLWHKAVKNTAFLIQQWVKNTYTHTVL